MPLNSVGVFTGRGSSYRQRVYEDFLFSGRADGKFPSKFLRVGASVILLPKAKNGFMVLTKIKRRRKNNTKHKWLKMSVLNEAESTMNQLVKLTK